tara:strand:- start:332 stop:562 length:231 start_codon:yes stop_codon:yes gene_type:complete
MDIFFPWHFRGQKYGYLEFADEYTSIEASAPTGAKMKTPVADAGSRYKARAENREKQSLIEGVATKTPSNGFSNIV